MSYDAGDAQGGFERNEIWWKQSGFVAIGEIAGAEIDRAKAYEGLPGEREPGKYVPGDVAWGVVRFLRETGLENLTLASIAMFGNWQGAQQVESEIKGALPIFEGNGYRARYIPRESPEASVLLKIAPRQTTQVGYVALHRVRTIAKATSLYATDPGTLSSDSRTVLTVRKNSWLSVSLDELQRFSADAAKEVNLILAVNLLQTCRLDPEMVERAVKNGTLTLDALDSLLSPQATDNDRARLEQLREKMARSRIPESLLFAKLFTDPSPILRSPATIGAFEVAIEARAVLLDPAANTYYLADTHHQTPAARR
jgi:hypothetical protein